MAGGPIGGGDRRPRAPAVGFCGVLPVEVGEEEGEDKRTRIMSRSFLDRWLRWGGSVSEPGKNIYPSK